MTNEKLQEGNKLTQTIIEMKRVEDYLRHATVKSTEVIMRISQVHELWISQEDGGHFVIEKMIEAGVYAAMTVRAAAENDLEKL